MSKLTSAIFISMALAVIVFFQNCSGFNTLSSVDSISSFSVGTGVTPIMCNTSFTPSRAPLRLLSNTEYDNIAKDVFLIQTPPSSTAKFDIIALGSTGFSNTGMTSDMNSPKISDLMIEKYWNAAGSIADEIVSNKASPGSFYSQIAACAVGVASVPDSCYDTVIRNFTLKAWRRPVAEKSGTDEFARLKNIFKSAANFDIGLHDIIRSALISPNFLVVSFRPSKVTGAGQAFNLDNFQLATRLSFFLWQSSPDDQLLNLAKNGTLTDMANLKAQVVRMLKDSKAKRFASTMTKEWLGANSILGIGLTAIDSATLNAMVTETQLMFEDVISSDVSFLNAITADYSFLNKTLADYYGVPFNGAVSTQFYKTSLSSTPRRGVLNQAAFLIATAGSETSTHPVPRGKIVAKNIACYDVPQPPGDLDTSIPSTVPAGSTPAEMLVIHRQRAQCAGCHAMLDPYGLPLESYDSFGKWRSTYANLGGRSIDPSGQFLTGEKFATTEDFMSALAANAGNRSCMVKKIMSLGLTRNIASADENCNSKQIAEVSMNPNSKFSDLIYNIVSSRQFRMQTME